jgi:hypothetical protein
VASDDYLAGVLVASAELGGVGLLVAAGVRWAIRRRQHPGRHRRD